MIRSYSEMIKFPTLQERFDYCALGQNVGDQTFGYERYMNQVFYRSYEWRKIKRTVILRDNGCEFGLPDYPIGGKIVVHHLNPLTADDILTGSDYLRDPEYLVCVSLLTHNAIHFGTAELLPQEYIPRSPDDTCPWKKGEKDVKKEIQQYVCTDARRGRKVLISI